MNYNVANKFRRTYVQYAQPTYMPFNSLGKWKAGCTDEMPVCPPMFHFNNKSIINEPPAPTEPVPQTNIRPERIQTLPVIDITRPRRIDPGSDPSGGGGSSNWPGGGGGSSDSEKPPNCRQCGPKILGVIGWPDPESRWPLLRGGDGDDADEETYPFTLPDVTIFTGDADLAGLKSVWSAGGSKWRVPGEHNVTINKSYKRIFTGKLHANFPTSDDATLKVKVADADLKAYQNGSTPLSNDVANSDVFTLNADGSGGIMPSAQNANDVIAVAGRVYFPNRGTVGSEMIQFSHIKLQDGFIQFTISGRSLAQDKRITRVADGNSPDSLIIVRDDDDEGDSVMRKAKLTVNLAENSTVPISIDDDDFNVFFEEEQYPESRGQSYTDYSFILLENTLMGGELGDGSGGALVQIRTTSWPDLDTSSCVMSSTSFPENTQTYCCNTGFLTRSDWIHGEGRCAPLAMYNTTYSLKHPQHCPAGYVYDTQGINGPDGLSCKRCDESTTSYDPDISPSANQCTAGNSGIGCQKCCEGQGRTC